MPTVWRQLLDGTVARWRDNELLGFSEATSEIEQALAGKAIAPLPSLGIIEASGADVANFLQSQLSNDILSLADGDSRLAAYCNPKGRMLALFRVVRRQDGYLLLLPATLIDTILKRLRMFVLRSKVTLTDVSEHWAGLGVCGSQAQTLLAEQGLVLPAEPDAGVWLAETALVRLRGDQPRALVLAPPQRMAALWAALAPLPQISEQAWRLLDIRAGVPEILPGAAEKIIPQMANLDLLGGISFTKGCYPGQEIVARMHYLGNLKRRMYRLQIATAEPPQPGTDVRTAEGSLAGEIVMAVRSLDGQSEALAVLQIDRAAAPDLQVDGSPAQALPVPYLQENK